MFNIFKPKDERDFLYLQKKVKRNKEKGGNIISLIEIPRIKKYIEDIINKNTLYDSISCYNKELTDILEGYFKEKDYLNKKNENLFKDTKVKLDDEIERNIKSLSYKLRTGVFIFSEKPKEDKKQKNSKKEGNIKEKHPALQRNKYYLSDMKDLLNDYQLDKEVLNAFFKGFINNVSKIKNHEDEYLGILKSLIKHPNFDKKILIDFMYSQMSKKDEKGYLDKIKGGDDLDLNIVKTFILKSKILQHHEVLGLASLPYIGLWEILINKYFLTQHLIIDFLDHIFKFKKPEEKEIVLNFINTKMSRIYKNPEIKYKIQDYMNS